MESEGLPDEQVLMDFCDQWSFPDTAFDGAALEDGGFSSISLLDIGPNSQSAQEKTEPSESAVSNRLSQSHSKRRKRPKEYAMLASRKHRARRKVFLTQLKEGTKLLEQENKKLAIRVAKLKGQIADFSVTHPDPETCSKRLLAKNKVLREEVSKYRNLASNIKTFLEKLKIPELLIETPFFQNETPGVLFDRMRLVCHQTASLQPIDYKVPLLKDFQVASG